MAICIVCDKYLRSVETQINNNKGISTNLNNTLKEIKIAILHPQSVNIICLIPNPDDDFQLNGKLVCVRILQPEK